MADQEQDEERTFEEREARTRALLREQAGRATELRSKEREFHGLERESRYDQAEMLGAYAKTKDMKHPRDLGAAREQILRTYLNNRGLLPKRYAVSDLSFRAASTTGHISRELDIALYDPLDSARLMVRENMFEVLPIESIYGAIQVKSRLNKKELREGLENLATVKRLRRSPGASGGFKFITGIPKSERAFGILFAFDTDTDWPDIIKGMEDFAASHPRSEWSNGVFILTKGYFFYGDKQAGARAENAALDAISTLQIYSVPDREELCLHVFQATLLRLLRNTEIYPADLDAYFRLPFVAGDQSYTFQFGQFAEFGTCDKHGDYSRSISLGALERVVTWCKASEPVNAVHAMLTAFGQPVTEEACRRQPGEVYIYNPEGLPLPDILTKMHTNGEFSYPTIACDMIETAGIRIYIPYYYSLKESIVPLFCPKCLSPLADLERDTTQQSD